MAIQTFVADTILTAAQMNALQGNDYNQTVSTKTASYTLVAADKGTKIVMNAGATSTTITVNTSLFAAGDTLTILNTSTSGTCTVTAGTATVASSGSLALGLNQGGTLYFTSAGVSVFQADGVTATASGLTLVRSQTIGSAVSSVQVTGAFNSTYANYFITINGGVASTNSGLRLTFGATATGYYFGANYVLYTGTSGVFSGANIAYVEECIYCSTNGISMNLFVQSPNLAARTMFNFQTAGPTTTSQNLSSRGGGYLNDATQYTTFTLTCNTGTITGGDILVYGYANS